MSSQLIIIKNDEVIPIRYYLEGRGEEEKDEKKEKEEDETYS